MELIRKIIFAILRFSGLPLLFRYCFQKNNITILLFHDIDKSNAYRTFKYLSKIYNIISLNLLVGAIEINDLSVLPKKALIITFDDGHINNYNFLQVIKELEIEITIFVCSSIINTNRHYWFSIKDKSIGISQLKKETNSRKLEILSKYNFHQEKEYEFPQALQKFQIQEMEPFINFQSHTKFHPCLPMCTNEVAREEILLSKIQLENDYGMTINAFAYPNGDYSERDIQIVKEAGYKCAITVDPGFNNSNTNRYLLKRFSVNDTSDLNELIVKASGVWAFFKLLVAKKEYGYTKINQTP